MGLMDHARTELQLAFPENDEMQNLINKDVLSLIEMFSEQGHSGFSANYVLDLFLRLAQYKILSPLSGNDAEWVDVSVYYGKVAEVYQNKRLSSVFKDNEMAYDIDARVLMDCQLTSYTNHHSRKKVIFPYVQKKERYISADEYKKYLAQNNPQTGENKT